MRTSEIIAAINNDFAATYRSATPFVDSGELWDFCIDTIRNPITLNSIVLANDLGIPPIKTLFEIYERKMNPSDNFTFSQQEIKNMGALMGFVFKFVLDYTKQTSRCTVKKFGAKTASRFYEGSVFNFEEWL